MLGKTKYPPIHGLNDFVQSKDLTEFATEVYTTFQYILCLRVAKVTVQNYDSRATITNLTLYLFSSQRWHQQIQNFSNLSAYCSKANLLVTPKKGKAVMWYNHVTEKSTGWLAGLDRMSYHGGCDVMDGEKWIMNHWINIIGKDFEDIRTWNDPHTKLHVYKDNKEKKNIGRLTSK